MLALSLLVCCDQALSQGRVQVCSTPSTNLDASSRNSQNIKDRHADQPAKQPVTYVEIKCQLDATEVFIADLIACSTCFGHHYAHHQEPKSIIQWLLPVVFRAAVSKLLIWCGAEGYVSGLQDAAASCKPDT